jgi:L-iditol 2-dehydrogenase
MKALMKTAPGPGNVELVDLPEPDCGPGQVKVRVAFCGVCGTDLHVYHDTFPNNPPVILGHEFAGTVVEAGEGVTRAEVGDQVTVLGSTAITCGTCRYCKHGYYMFCPARRGMGHGTNGAFTEYVVVRDDQLYRLPDAVGLETGALAEPLAACVQAVCEVATFSAGDVVLLSGPGPIGLLCLALLRAQGCRVIVAGTAEDGLRLGIARDLGAYRTVTVPDEDLQAVVECQTGGMGVDAAVECAGVAASVAACLEAVRPMGQHLQIGIVGESIPVPLDLAVFKQITVHGTIGHSFRTWDAVIRLMAQGELDLSPIITHRLPLSDWREAFDLCERKQCGKVLLRCSE